MKKSLISILLGLSFVVSAPAAFADKGDHWKIEKNDYNRHHQKKHIYKHNDRHRGRPFRHGHDNRTSIVIRSDFDYFPDRVFWNDTRYYDDGYFRPSINEHYLWEKRINERRANQKRRIRQGIRNGQLVPAEVRKLRQQQRRIAKRFRHFKYDGRLSRYERNEINRMLDNASDKIYRKRHNNLTRDSRRHHGNHHYYD